jgi:hypothetical protein
VPRRRVRRTICNMERIEFLRARISLYRRYLREGVDGEVATAYLWLIRQDEVELTGLAKGSDDDTAPDGETEGPAGRR